MSEREAAGREKVMARGNGVRLQHNTRGKAREANTG